MTAYEQTPEVLAMSLEERDVRAAMEQLGFEENPTTGDCWLAPYAEGGIASADGSELPVSWDATIRTWGTLGTGTWPTLHEWYNRAGFPGPGEKYVWIAEGDHICSGTLRDYAKDLATAHYSDVSVKGLWIARNDALVKVHHEVRYEGTSEDDYMSFLVIAGADAEPFSVDGRA